MAQFCWRPVWVVSADAAMQEDRGPAANGSVLRSHNGTRGEIIGSSVDILICKIHRICRERKYCKKSKILLNKRKNTAEMTKKILPNVAEIRQVCWDGKITKYLGEIIIRKNSPIVWKKIRCTPGVPCGLWVPTLMHAACQVSLLIDGVFLAQLAH
jgi:hypothetical protein